MSSRQLPKNKPCPDCWGVGELPRDSSIVSTEDIQYVCKNCGNSFGYDE